MEIETILSSKANELNHVKTWLKEEFTKHNKGFYSNWDTIQEAWKDNRCYVLLSKGEAIGFLIFRRSGPVANIMAFEIKPSLRSKGFGKKLFEDFTNLIQNLGDVAVELFCSPISSKDFWKKMGFELLTDLYKVKSKRIEMYKVIVPQLASDGNGDEAETIALWDMEYYDASGFPPKWIWELKFKKNSRILLEPIIHPMNFKWLMEWKVGGRVLFSGPVLDFTKEIIEHGDFIVITQLLK